MVELLGVLIGITEHVRMMAVEEVDLGIVFIDHLFV